MKESQSLYEEHMQDLMHELTFSEKWERIRHGLKQDPESGEFKWADHEFRRVVIPGVTSLLSLLLLLTGLFLLVRYAPDEEEITANVTMMEEKDLETPKPDPPKKPDPVENNEVEVELPDASTLAEAEIPNPEQMENRPEQASVKPQQFNSVMQVVSPVSLPRLYTSRTPGEIGDALVANDGDDGTENAVLKALRWLKRNQKADGSWEGVSTAMTGLAVLCFLAHGETPASKEFGPTVDLALKYLITQQKADGHYGNTGGHHVYGNAIANYAMAEAYGMTRIYSLKEVMNKGIRVIVEGQQQSGGWDYDYKDGGRTDLSVMAWQAQALKAAIIANCDVEGLHEAKYKAIPAFKGFQTAQGGFGYTNPANRELTGAAVLCLQMLEDAASVEIRRGLEHMYEWRIDWQSPSKGGVGRNPLYHWYYITQAKFQAGKAEFGPWNDVMKEVLPAMQAPDGHWSHPMAHEKTPVYSTTLCCLMLEVYYRHLPTFKAEGVDHDPVQNQARVDALDAIEREGQIKVF